MKLKLLASNFRPMTAVMNPSLAEMEAEKRAGIVFVHVGKCAGGSVMKALRRGLTRNHAMFELHTRNANQLLRETLFGTQKEFTYLIALRDPISRFVSAFNWDKHRFFLNEKTRAPYVKPFFEEFRTADMLACALSSDDSDKAARALEFSRFGHMGMGQGWYVPADVVTALPKARTWLCETERLAEDLQNFAAAMDERYAKRRLEVGHDKAEFTAGYDNRDELFSKKLSVEGRRNLRILLNDDYRSQRLLKQRFGRR